MVDNCLGPPLICKSFPLSFSIPSPNPLLFRFSPSSSQISRSLLSMSMANPQESSSKNQIQPSLLIFSGGTACNGVVEEMKKLTTRVVHVLPVSDDGGSTAEIVRVLGGPAVGDIKSRCLRLSDESTSETLAVRRLLGHRLPLDGAQARSEWYDIVEGEHSLWNGHWEFFFAGARIFFQSLDAAIFLFSRVSDIPPESLVLPVISTNDRLTLGCQLWDGTIIRGENEISHPSIGPAQPVDKPSRIKRIFYTSSEGRNLLHEVFPTVNPSVLEQLSKVDCIVYAMGSLFISVCPSLVLLGTGEVVSSRSCPKPSQYVNALLVPKDGQIPVDVQSLSKQGIFHVVIVDSRLDPRVGIIFNPKSLIQALADLITEYNSPHSSEV
ncbi:hypothetical protein MKW92_036372 [Papaver armeniacum]|nr:hypothetical protein MKW92_036372 [Papaver armeniacum]